MPKKDDCSPSADDWQAGDLALCVVGGQLHPHPIPQPEGYPVSGAIYTVKGFTLRRRGDENIRCLDLLDGPLNVGLRGSDRSWGAFRFRKIHPLSEKDTEKFSVENLIKA